MIKWLIIVIIEIITLYIGVRFLYNYNEEKEKDNDTRLHEIEKRLGELENLLLMEIKGVLNNVELHEENYLKYFDIIEKRIKKLEKVKK
ncbi:MAG: hypothetical protein J6T10_16440 [Methanobrevibacter sp.]|nr:hypothetical protein [Methanobrevibacter sp.]